MQSLSTLVNYIDTYLSVGQVSDYPQAYNGLQLENSGRVRRMAAAVDASEGVVMEAVSRGVDFLVVHHGLMWNAGTWTGGRYRKLRTALSGDLAVYSVHLPLDVHPTVGNNVLLAKALGLRKLRPFLMRKGQALGLRGEVNCSLMEMARRLEGALENAAHLCPGGPSRVRQVGVVTGGAGSEVEAAAAEGVDTFVTGEGPHWSYPLAEELGLNVFYGGHYATETFGVKALCEHLSKRFKLDWEFIDRPTGL
jgi:dinuclear metal center YbgI/SA1388 family protein